jgi:hypothetical protein
MTAYKIERLVSNRIMIAEPANYPQLILERVLALNASPFSLAG